MNRSRVKGVRFVTCVWWFFSSCLILFGFEMSWDPMDVSTYLYAEHQ